MVRNTTPNEIAKDSIEDEETNKEEKKNDFIQLGMLWNLFFEIPQQAESTPVELFDKRQDVLLPVNLSGHAAWKKRMCSTPKIFRKKELINCI